MFVRTNLQGAVNASLTDAAERHRFCGCCHMSQAFVKESDEQWLHEIAPTMTALIVYLTRENNGIRVYEKAVRADKKTGNAIHQMSNGLEYTIDADGRWSIV